MKLSIAMPVFNEEDALRLMLPECKRVMDQAGITYEVVIGNNNSTDLSSEIAKQYGAIVVNEKRRGYGFALKAAISEAQGDVIVTLDADNTYPIESIPLLYEKIQRDQLDLLIANRFDGRYLSLRTMPFINRFGNMFLSFVIQRLFSVNIVDSQSGMVMFSKSFKKEACAVPHDDFSYPQSMKVLFVSKYKVKYAEQSIPYNYRIGVKKLNAFADGFKNLLSLFLLKMSF
jgi:glycosyltransferase involved in cell wall biosynthesis